MSNSGSASNLVQAARMLNLEWDKVRAYWRDSRAVDFEKKYITDLPAQVASTTNAMEEIDMLLQKVRTDCE